MDRIDKISEERLFQNNTKEEIMRWCSGLHYFHYMRARGGHNCEGDSFAVYFNYDGLDDLTAKLAEIGVALNRVGDGDFSFDPFKSYSLDDLDNLKITIAEYPEWEQPQYVELFGNKVHIWVLNDRFEISVSGSKDGQVYKVSEEDFAVCRTLEKRFDELGWHSIVDDNVKSLTHCISERNYPELF
ncbi:hypothetical protein [Dysgonomonas sp. 25]|uniref:hypothetical protein n=1 Tax=Dysgonomonas sp. 25 TaxID=2302933 RepID=UPI0013D0EFF5|nr:hypothetical protein [Dysgonomonas sp. 25]NDV68524.1 hypothetical protein [Dysgonomonas sp. 25]